MCAYPSTVPSAHSQATCRACPLNQVRLGAPGGGSSKATPASTTASPRPPKQRDGGSGGGAPPPRVGGRGDADGATRQSSAAAAPSGEQRMLGQRTELGGSCDDGVRAEVGTPPCSGWGRSQEPALKWLPAGGCWDS
jgi:hypothetical protein